jgi:multiple sugar transport system substrate-binding protein
MVALQGGTPVEVSTAYENMVAEYMRGNAVVNLDDYVKDPTLGYSKEGLDDIFPAYLEGLRFPQYGNQLLSFPFTKSLVVMYVNEEVLQRANVKLPPNGAWTWPDFAQAVQAASRADRSLIVDQEIGNVTDPSRLRTYGWANYPSASTINAWAYSRGGSMLTADNKQVRFNEPPYLDSFQLTEDTFKRQFAYNPPRQPGSDFDFASNRYAFIHQSSTSRPFLRRVLKDNGREQLPWRITSVPQKDPGKAATVQYGANIAIFRTTDIKQAAAWLFVKWFTERDQDVQWSITSSYMPIRKSSSEHPTLKAYWEKDDPQGKQAFDLAKTARPEPNIRGTEDIRTVIQNALQEVMEGKKSSKAALEEATRQANQLLQTAG